MCGLLLFLCCQFNEEVAGGIFPSPESFAAGRLRSGTDVGSVRAAFCRTNRIGSCENLQKRGHG